MLLRWMKLPSLKRILSFILCFLFFKICFTTIEISSLMFVCLSYLLSYFLLPFEMTLARTVREYLQVKRRCVRYSGIHLSVYLTVQFLFRVVSQTDRPACICICICVCVYVYVYVYVFVYVYVYVCVCAYVCVYVYVYIIL